MNFRNYPPRSVQSVQRQIDKFRAGMYLGPEKPHSFAQALGRTSQENHLAYLYEELEWVKSLNLPPRVPEEIEAELKGVSEIKANYMKHADSASTRFSIKSLEEAQLELRQELERANAILQKITV